MTVGGQANDPMTMFMAALLEVGQVLKPGWSTGGIARFRAKFGGFSSDQTE
jgi:hypothetical protein